MQMVRIKRSRLQGEGFIVGELGAEENRFSKPLISSSTHLSPHAQMHTRTFMCTRICSNTSYHHSDIYECRARVSGVSWLIGSTLHIHIVSFILIHRVVCVPGCIHFSLLIFSFYVLFLEPPMHIFLSFLHLVSISFFPLTYSFSSFLLS